jgi:hypothetical protein
VLPFSSILTSPYSTSTNYFITGNFLFIFSDFRYLSHKFHGKGPGKNKVEKRMKKNEQEGVSIGLGLVIGSYF